MGGQQFYRLPPNYSKLKSVTLTDGALTWTMKEIQTIDEWNKLNVFPYYANIPDSYFIFPGGDHGSQLGIWPIPSSSNLSITFWYKYRIPDLSIADYSTGTVSVSNGSTTVTGSGTSWTTTTNAQNESRWIQFPQTTGDNLWYQVLSVNSATSLTLYQPYQGISVSGGTYVLGQMPILPEDFQDMLVFKALVHYFSSVVDNKDKRAWYQGQYNEKLKMLEDYAGGNTINVNLGRKTVNRNPNLFGMNYGN
jgi:hypothetical protein